MPSPVEVAQDLPTRMRAAQVAAKDAEAALKLRLKQRDELVVEAIDHEGMTQKAVAKIMGFHPSRIHAILRDSQKDDQ